MEATKLIQLVWRHHRLRLEKQQEDESEANEETYQLIRVPFEKKFQVRFWQQCRRMRRVRRQLAELQIRTGDRLDTHHGDHAHCNEDRRRDIAKHYREEVLSDDGHTQPVQKDVDQLQKEKEAEQDAQLTELSLVESSRRELEEWEYRRERMKKYYAKAVRNLHKLMVELDKDASLN